MSDTAKIKDPTKFTECTRDGSHRTKVGPAHMRPLIDPSTEEVDRRCVERRSTTKECKDRIPSPPIKWTE